MANGTHPNTSEESPEHAMPRLWEIALVSPVIALILAYFNGFLAASAHVIYWLFPSMSGWLGFVVAVMTHGLLFVLAEQLSDGALPRAWAWVLGAPLLLFAVGCVLYSFLEVATWMSRAPPIFAGISILICAGVLFALRHARRSVYGLLEVAVGLVVGTSKMLVGNALPPLTMEWKTVDAALAVLCAGVYLVVRGLDNIQVGLTKEPKDPWALATLHKLIGPGGSRSKP